MVSLRQWAEHGSGWHGRLPGNAAVYILRVEEEEASLMAMSWRGQILEVRYGPVRMRISARSRGCLHQAGALAAGRRAEQALHELSSYRSAALQPRPLLPSSRGLPRVLSLMIEAVDRAGDPTLTPMAAVAGSIAQVALEAALSLGASTIIVENGGDIALAVGDGEVVRVGVARSLADRRPTHVITVTADSAIAGVCTSGLGGRSFTRGIAETTAVAAESPALADACATVIANAVYVDDPAIRRRPARELDPDTDIPTLLVTCHVGDLPPTTLERALSEGTREARKLLAMGAIAGAVVGVSGNRRIVVPPGFASPLE